MKCHDHWRTRHLPAFIESRKSDPIRWGWNDCCLFAADAVLSITGVDIAVEFRGRYRSRRGAFSLIRRLTGGSTAADAVAYCAKGHGMPELPFPLMAGCGDLVILDDGDQLIAGVVGHDGYPLSVSATGLCRFPITAVRRAWKV